MLKLRFVIRWEKGHLFFDQQGNEKKLWEIARGKRSWGHREMWDEKKHRWCKIGVVAMPIRHAGYAGKLWLVVGRRKGEPWYLITNEPVETEKQAWFIIYTYGRRWQIETTFRYGKSEMAMESPRLQKKEERDKLLSLVTLVPRGLVPDRVRDRVGAVGQASDGFGEREGGTFGLGKVGGFAPGGHGEDSLVAFARLLQAV
jgi:hypothetical protein